MKTEVHIATVTKVIDIADIMERMGECLEGLVDTKCHWCGQEQTKKDTHSPYCDLFNLVLEYREYKELGNIKMLSEEEQKELGQHENP